MRRHLLRVLSSCSLAVENADVMMSIRTGVDVLGRAGGHNRFWQRRITPFLMSVMIFGQASMVCAAAEGWGVVKVGPGDRIVVTVFGQTDISGEYLVGDDGDILLPLV